MTHNGWRKPTPGLLVAEKHAKVGEQSSVPKAQAIVALKKVAASLGLKAADILFIDTFAALTQPQDWEKGRRPVVWPSNLFLEEQTGLSLRAVQRHIRRLCEAGIIFMKDSPNGKRWGSRDENGYITEAYGFDLAPIAARMQEFETLYAGLQEERRLCATLRNKITISRRIIRAKIDKAVEDRLSGAWAKLTSEFAFLIEQLPRRSASSKTLLRMEKLLRGLQKKVENEFSAAIDDLELPAEKAAPAPRGSHSFTKKNFRKMTPTSDSSDTHIQTTNQPDPVKSNCFEEKHAAGSVPETQPTGAVESSDLDLDSIKWDARATSQQKGHVELSTVMAACPAFATMACGMIGYVKDWNDLHRVAGMVRPMVGISEDAWNVAQQKLGPYVAAAAMSLIYDKYDKDEIVSAGGYLRGMVTKAIEGELNLDRSFYGRLSGAGAYSSKF